MRGVWRLAVLLVLTAALTACGPLEAQSPDPGGSASAGAKLAPLVLDPPESARAARASDATYSVYQGVVCGVVPRPEHGYTLRYPKIWIAREQGATTWLADNSDDQRLVGIVRSEPAPAVEENLAALLAEGWRSADLRDLRLDPLEAPVLGGHPAERWNLRYTAPDATPMAGYTAAMVANGRLYRVEVALPAARYERLDRAAEILVEQLIITPRQEG